MRERPGNQLISRDRYGINAKTPAINVSRRADLVDVSMSMGCQIKTRIIYNTCYNQSLLIDMLLLDLLLLPVV